MPKTLLLRTFPGKRIAWGAMVLLSLLMVVLASRYLTLDPEVFFPQQRAVYVANTIALVAHIVGGMFALLLGPVQFVPSVRRRWPRVHRWLGRGYLVGIVVGGAAGLWMARLAYGGRVAQVGFAVLALAWLTTSFAALARIRAGDVVAHRRWMVRSFALTFAAVMLRVELPLLAASGLSFEAAYAVVAWSCWVPNLVAAELLMARAGGHVASGRLRTAA